MISFLTRLFPVWILIASAAALFFPNAFTWFRGAAITWALAFIMLGMGMTLTGDDWKRMKGQPRVIFLGFVFQYTIMPIAGFLVAWAFQLPPAFAVGLILVACCPGGTASNVVSYLARADVAASVCMTASTTLFAPVMTPFLTAVLAGSKVSVPFFGLFLSTVQVVLLPVFIGYLINRYRPDLVKKTEPYLPLFSVTLIVLIVASIIGSNREAIFNHGLQLLGAVFCLHAFGFLFGYIAARMSGMTEVLARTVSIEVGMQNSGLGVVLARKHFPDPLTAVPSAMSSAMHSILGSVLAAYWKNQKPKTKRE